MSVTGISSSSFPDYSIQSVRNNAKQIEQEFLQLGKDLQSGNLCAAQADFTALQQLTPQNSSTSSTPSNSPLAQAFNQLAKDLQSGNLSAAQQDYTTSSKPCKRWPRRPMDTTIIMGAAVDRARSVSC